MLSFAAVRFLSTLARWCLVILCVTCLCTCGSEPGYFVSNNGDDANPGTQALPFKTIRKLNSISYKPGDRIYFMGNEVFNGSLNIQVSGTSRDPVKISSYGETVATINAGDSAAISITGSQFVLSHIHVRGSGRMSNHTSGVIIKEASAGKIENVKSEGFQKAGLEIFDSKGIDVKNVYTSENGFAGIYVGASRRLGSKNITITDCQAVNNPGDPTNMDNHSGNGILVGMADSVKVEYSVASNNGWGMPRKGNGPVGIWAYESDHVLIQHCISYGNRTSKGGLDGGGFDLDGGVKNSVIQYCLSYENEGSGFGLFQYEGASPWRNNIVRYCVSINDGTVTPGAGGILIWNGSQDSTQLTQSLIHNNVIYNSHVPAIAFEQNSLNNDLLFFNNIFIGNNDILKGPSSGEKFEGNVWWHTSSNEITFRGYTSLEEWSKATGQEVLDGTIAGKQTDPMLWGPYTTDITDPHLIRNLSGYRLRERSPLLNSGVNLKIKYVTWLLPEVDFFGAPLPQGSNYDPGVCEFRE